MEKVDIKRFHAHPTEYVKELKQPKLVKKAWGTELIIENTTKYCAKLMTVVDRGVCSIHWHPEKEETFVLISGKLDVLTINLDTGKHEHTMLENIGDSITIKPGTPHSFKRDRYHWGSTVFMECSTQDNAHDNVRISQSEGPGLDEDKEE
jgi:mannose-6-phosphate isomerase-like protein (cupin superfamily)